MVRFSSIFVLGLASLFSSATAFAQTCSNNAADNLLACSHVAIESCRADNACVDDRRQVLSVQDVIEEAAANCCPLSSRRERACLNTFAKRLASSRARGPRELRPFLAEARLGVLGLKTNGCDTGTLGDI